MQMESVTQNGYTYVSNNPIQYIDTNGKSQAGIGIWDEPMGSTAGSVAGTAIAVGGGIYVGNKIKAKKAKKVKKVKVNRITADEIISKEKKGSIRKEFPTEWLDNTIEEIEEAAKKGLKNAKKAKKLLTDKEFNKGSNSKRSKKGK
ncbi:hypothetical protein ACFWM3_17895 [Gottfriedia sp. NPDC058432]|uniref:hypothetical protein n=1 Tax=Gottfriedia sp. NPDC058432 TaxID=3346497 RepID=UPI0036576E6D